MRNRVKVGNVFVVVFGLLGVASNGLGTEPVPSNINIHTDPGESSGIGGFRFRYSRYRPEKFEKSCAVVFINADKNPNWASQHDYSMIMHLRDGDLIPLEGQLYCCSTIWANPVKLIPVAKADMPPGLTPQANTYLLPFRTTASLYSRKMVFWEATINAGAIEARIEFDPTITDALDDPKLVSRESCVVKVGELLPITTRGVVRKHVVLSIVPPDSEKKIVGWVEIGKLAEVGM